MEGYVIFYWNGEQYDDRWSGILETEGVFLKQEDADKRVIELQKDHLFKLNDKDNEDNWGVNSNETWQVKPITIHN